MPARMESVNWCRRVASSNAAPNCWASDQPPKEIPDDEPAHALVWLTHGHFVRLFARPNLHFPPSTFYSPASLLIFRSIFRSLHSQVCSPHTTPVSPPIPHAPFSPRSTLVFPCFYNPPSSPRLHSPLHAHVVPVHTHTPLCLHSPFCPTPQSTVRSPLQFLFHPRCDMQWARFFLTPLTSPSGADVPTIQSYTLGVASTWSALSARAKRLGPAALRARGRQVPSGTRGVGPEMRCASHRKCMQLGLPACSTAWPSSATNVFFFSACRATFVVPVPVPQHDTSSLQHHAALAPGLPPQVLPSCCPCVLHTDDSHPVSDSAWKETSWPSCESASSVTNSAGRGIAAMAAVAQASSHTEEAESVECLLEMSPFLACAMPLHMPQPLTSHPGPIRCKPPAAVTMPPAAPSFRHSSFFPAGLLACMRCPRHCVSSRPRGFLHLGGLVFLTRPAPPSVRDGNMLLPAPLMTTSPPAGKRLSMRPPAPWLNRNAARALPVFSRRCRHPATSLPRSPAAAHAAPIPLDAAMLPVPLSPPCAW